MIILYTPRLKLIPLNADDIKVGLYNKTKMDMKLGLEPTGIPFSESIRSVLLIKTNKIHHDRVHWLYYTFWQIVLTERNCSIGEVCFSGPPSTNGEIEVGYYIDDIFQGKGYMTEALTAIINWAFSQPEVSCVKARTTNNNYASHKVLKKVGMTLYLKETFYWWIIRR